jgi:hypothetical protein
MRISKHARSRCQQRGIPSRFIELILEYGAPVRNAGNATEYRLLKGDKAKIESFARSLLQNVDKISHKAVLLSDDAQTVITLYNVLD